MSAIPWVGQDIVESKEITEIYSEAIILSSLPVIGTVHKNALKKGKNNSRLENQEYLNIPSSFLAFFAGLVDGDGYIQITNTTKGFITIKLVISLHLEDLSTLEYINSVLKVGKLNIYRDNRSPTCKLVINRTDLQEIVFPLFLYNNIFFLTETRSKQFNSAMYILKNDIRTFDKIPKDIPVSFELPKTPLDYTKLLFFRNWIVGFAMSEGSFFVKANNDGCFQLKQRIHINLFEAFKLVFDTNRKIETEKGLYNQFGVSSKSDIQKVINFFSFSGLHPLVGLKGIQYIKWLNSLRASTRYNSLNFPEAVL
uniref:LAGLIDADG endonuclease n=1 Tax=Bipolaris cookei TaxID=74410 RepID=A0A2H4NRT4_9PLEO|nr:LAGLIDADG endonuclease [Bipolaris cookei]ATV95711.1 LAGLIDADG endonuclease [Bipolaris cookei]